MSRVNGKLSDVLLRFIYTGFYSGYSPKAPGTAGSLVAWLISLILFLIFGANSTWILSIFVIIMLYPSILLGNHAEKEIGAKDPQCVVFDEMMGYWIALIFLPFTFRISLAALLLFRFFDILKPPPINGVQRLKGGLGIMLDDYIAGVFANILIWALVLQERISGVAIL